MFAPLREYDESREESQSDERDCETPSNRGHVQATRLFDKLDQLERKWQSQKSHQPQKSHQRSLSHHAPPVQAPSEREQPEALHAPIFSRLGPSERPIDKSDSYTSSVLVKIDTSKQKKGARRIVSMFDRLYQKGKAKSITRGRTAPKQSKPKVNRNKRRQRAATIIQAALRGRKSRKKLQQMSQNAGVMQKWWRDASQRLFFVRLRGSTLILQTWERKRQVLQTFQRKLKAVLAMQGLWRVYVAKLKRQELIAEREKTIRATFASTLIQGMMIKKHHVLRTKRVECNSLMVEEAVSDDMETCDCNTQIPVERILSGEIGGDSSLMSQDASPSPVSPTEDSNHLHGVEGHAEAHEGASPTLISPSTVLCIPPKPHSASAALYRAAQARRRAMKAEPSQAQKVRSSSNSRRQSQRSNEMTLGRSKLSTPCKYNSIAYQYLPTKKTYWSYDAVKLAKVPVLQRWTRQQILQNRKRHSSSRIACAWRMYRAQFHLISSCLLKEWSVRVDFRQEETTNNPILRQKVRLLALTNAIRQVNDQCIQQEVMQTSHTIFVSWKTEASIFFGDDQSRAELNRCSIHVVCEAHRHPLWESWSTHRKFTFLSKGALMKSFANQCARLSRASVLLQSLKMRRILLNMTREKEAALIIQRFWKQYGQESHEMKYLRVARLSATRLQAWWRMTMCIYVLEIEDMSACSIQAAYRGSVVRRAYVRSRLQIVRLQSVFRGPLRRIISRRKLTSALRIQGSFRGYFVRMRLHKQIYAALAIQDWYRAVILRFCMSKMRLSYSILQCLVQRQAILSRLQAEQSAVQLQAWWRKSTAFGTYNLMCVSALDLQRLFRGHQGRASYKAMVDAYRFPAAVRLQAWLRMALAREKFNETQLFSLNIQRIYRGHRARKTCQDLREWRVSDPAALQLQSWWRMTLVGRTIARNQFQARQIQKVYHGFKARDSIRKDVSRASARRLQACWRKHVASKTFARMLSLSLSLQKLFRGQAARRRYESLLTANVAAAIIQLAWDDHRDRKAANLYKAIVLVQKVTRSHQVRQQIDPVEVFCRSKGTACRYLHRHHFSAYTQMHLSATCIQSSYRRFLARCVIENTNAVLVQKVTRGHQVRQLIDPVEVFCRSKGTACHYLRQHHCSAYMQMHLSATYIQSSYRRFLTLCVIEKHTNAAVKIQAWSRMISATEDYEEILVASVILQCWGRMVGFRYRFRKTISAVVKIQSFWRSSMCVLAFAKLRQYLTTFQAIYRGVSTRRQMRGEADRGHATLCSGSSVSMHEFGDENSAVDVAREYQLCSILTFPADKTEISATLVQTAYRSYACKNLYLKTRSSALVIQGSWRHYSSREQNVCTRAVIHDDGIEIECMPRPQHVVWLKKLRTLAAVLVQSWIRAKQQHRKYLLVQKNATNQMGTKVLGNKITIKDSDLTLENAVDHNKTEKVSLPSRFWLFNQEVVLSLPVSIATCLEKVQTIDALCVEKKKSSRINAIKSRPVTRVQVRNQLRLIVSSAEILQTWWRLRLHCTLQTKRAMATKIQAVVRTTLALAYVVRLRSVLKIQKQYRKVSCATKFHRILKGVILLQREWLRYTDLPQFKARVERRNRGIIALQRLAQQSFQCKTASVTKMQRLWRLRRGILALQKVVRARFEKRAKSAQIICRNLRMLLARSAFMRSKEMATRLQSQWRCLRDHAAFKKQRSGFVCLQLLWAQTFQQKTKAVTLLQAQWKTSSAKAAYHQERLSAVALQKAWRKCSCVLAYAKMCSGFGLLRKQARIWFSKNSESAMLVQRTWRMYSKREEYCKAYGLICVVQKLAKERFYCKNKAVVLLQKTWRMRATRSGFQKVVRAFVFVQSIQRGIRCRSSYVQMRHGFEAIQRRARQSFRPKAKAISRLQRHWRMNHALSAYTSQRCAAIRMQAQWRLFSAWSKYITLWCGICSLQDIAHRKLKRKTVSAVLVQSKTRMYFAKTIYGLKQLGTILIQRQWRRRVCEGRFRRQVSGFAILQLIAKQHYKKKEKSATLSQAYRRMIIAKLAYKEKRAASVVLQSRFRGVSCKSAYATMRRGYISLQVLAKLWFRIKNTCAAQIQTATRRMLGRKRFQMHTLSAVKVQSAFRGFNQRRNQAVLQWLHSIASTMIASWWRRISHEIKYQRMRNATLVLQRGFRRQKTEKAAVRLQTWWRCCHSAQIYELARRSATIIESEARVFLATCQRRHAAASVIQKAWMASQQRFLVRCLLVLGRAKAAIAIQRWWREVQLLRHHRELLSAAKKRRTTDAARRQRHKKQASDPVVSMFCNFDFGNLAAGLTINNIIPWGVESETTPEARFPAQRKERRLRSKTLDSKLKARAAVIIQRHWRQSRRSRAKENYYKSVSAAWIQCIWRGYSARRQYNQMRGNKAAAALQVALKDVQLQRVETKHVMSIQSMWRGHMLRSRYSYTQILRHGASILIQRVWRLHWQRQRFLRARTGTKTIQRLVRDVMKRNSAARKIQRAWWISQLRGTAANQESRTGRSLPSMVLKAGAAWILSDPRVIEFALNGGG